MCVLVKYIIIKNGSPFLNLCILLTSKNIICFVNKNCILTEIVGEVKSGIEVSESSNNYTMKAFGALLDCSSGPTIVIPCSKQGQNNFLM